MLKKVVIVLAGVGFIGSLVLFTLPQKEILPILPIEDEIKKSEVKSSDKKIVQIEYEKEKEQVFENSNRKTFISKPKMAKMDMAKDPVLSNVEQRARMEYRKRAYYERQRAYHLQRRVDYFKRQKELSQLKSQREYREPLLVKKDGMMTPQKQRALAYKRFQEERRVHILMAQRAKERAKLKEQFN